MDGTGKVVLSQLVDMDGDEAPDELVFQTELGPRESKNFSLAFAKRPTPTREQFKVYGRFVRERHDDFAWENDRIARRIYGPDLEVWPREPLTSSGIDVWVKRSRHRVINDWYMLDDYHHDRGEGGDFYSVGKSRGCGGVGIWSQDKLHVSRNFTKSRVLANGPVRLVFELDYAPWNAGGIRVAETKRVILDAGQNFERIESTLRTEGGRGPLEVGIGIAKHPGSQMEADPKARFLRTWEPLEKENGHLGCAVVLPPTASFDTRQTPSDFLVITPAPHPGPLVYYVGSGWDQSGDFVDAPAWGKRVASVAQEAAAPLEVSMAPGALARPWSSRACDSIMTRAPGVLTDRWHYDTGFVLFACERVGEKTHDQQTLDYVKRTIDGLVGADGSIRGYQVGEYNLDQINMGNVVFALLERAGDPGDQRRYRQALDLLRSQLKTQPRTKEGGFWHKQIYPHQMWLDGLYMASPFLARYAAKFHEPALLREVARQIAWMERHARDPKTGLLYHGWDESGQSRWANPKTGTSPTFWGRAMGWYAMALVDVLELMPAAEPERAEVMAVLERLAAAVAKVQDPDTGVWWQVLDAPKRAKNYRESSASAMFVYALSKGVRNGWLDRKRYASVVERGYAGMLRQFVEVDSSGLLSLTNVCPSAGLGGDPYRDGSYDYYTSVGAVPDDPKGLGAYILASLERE
jgi:unsaturated rhamnogalacturonyl hydrolase